MYCPERRSDVSGPWALCLVSSSWGVADTSLALFGWHDLNTQRFVGIMIAIAVSWRIVAWWSTAARVGGFR